MTAKLNCWEFLKCGRESDGAKTTEYGVCPAATETDANGRNGGKNGGRICWAIAGTFCDETTKGSFAKEIFSCMSCDFFELVNKEENYNNYEILTPVQLKEFFEHLKKQ